MTQPRLTESDLVKETAQRAVQTLIERYFHSIAFSVTVLGITLMLNLSPLGTTVAITFNEPCQSQDPEPKADPSTGTETLD